MSSTAGEASLHTWQVATGGPACIARRGYTLFLQSPCGYACGDGARFARPFELQPLLAATRLNAIGTSYGSSYESMDRSGRNGGLCFCPFRLRDVSASHRPRHLQCDGGFSRARAAVGARLNTYPFSKPSSQRVPVRLQASIPKRQNNGWWVASTAIRVVRPALGLASTVLRSVDRICPSHHCDARNAHRAADCAFDCLCW
jgi:hypothetical protein